jgi:hypothetical protein
MMVNDEMAKQMKDQAAIHTLANCCSSSEPRAQGTAQLDTPKVDIDLFVFTSGGWQVHTVDGGDNGQFVGRFLILVLFVVVVTDGGFGGGGGGSPFRSSMQMVFLSPYFGKRSQVMRSGHSKPYCVLISDSRGVRIESYYSQLCVCLHDGFASSPCAFADGPADGHGPCVVLHADGDVEGAHEETEVGGALYLDQGPVLVHLQACFLLCKGTDC